MLNPQMPLIRIGLFSVMALQPLLIGLVLRSLSACPALDIQISKVDRAYAEGRISFREYMQWKQAQGD